MSKSFGRWSAMTMGLVLLTSVAGAAPLSKSDLPSALKDWLPWALHGQGAIFCPAPYNGDDAKPCVWPSQLALRAGTNSATFKLDIDVFGEAAMVALPGDATAWPQDVKSNGQALAVADVEGHPSVLLKPGKHHIEGLIPWTAMPQDLWLPPGVGSVLLWVDGAPVRRAPDAQGRVWLKQPPEQTQSGDAYTVHTTRLVDDQVPLRVITHFDLTVSGKAREIELPAALLPGMVAESIDSALPVRLQEGGKDGGKLMVQARSGNWSVEVRGRLMAPVQALSLPAGVASPEEVWSFAAHNDVRLVSVEGVASVDPKQVAMPEAWRAFPAYRLLPGHTMKLVQTRRGNPLPNPDNLTIARELWLDFDGQGYTVHDDITGTLSRSSRLEMAPPGSLGRAAAGGEDQPITRLKAQGPDGLELRNGAAQLSADSRVAGPVRSLPATGWLVDFNHASAVLNLPPGWRLLHATGVDKAEGSWVSLWTLWDFFFVLLSALAAGKLFGVKKGALLGAALVVSWHMPGAPQSLWLAWLGCQALGRVLPSGKLLTLSSWAAHVCAALIAVLLLPYAVQQVRLSMYPSLERPWQIMAETQDDSARGNAAGMAQAPAPMAESDQAVESSSSSRNEYQVRSLAKRELAAAPEPRRPLADVDPGAKVQTGPGLPSWQWNQHRLIWQGPVQQSQSLRLITLPPAGTVLLRLGSLALMVLAWALMLGKWPLFPRGGAASLAAALIVALGVTVTPHDALASEAATPSSLPASSVLEDMRSKLSAPPDCMPTCANIARLLVVASNSRVQLRLEAHALADVSLPLPAQGSNWQPSLITVDGKPAVTRRDGSGALWIALSKGVSQVVLESDVGDASTVDISLPMPVREIKAQTEGWSLAGLDARGLATGALSLAREQTQSHGQEQGTQRDALPPFVRVERTLRLGLRWTVETHVVRVAPSLAPVRVSLRLLNGESVNDDAIQVKDGVATLQLGAQDAAGFVSSLKVSPRLQLVSSTQPHQIEVWKLDASTQWHARLAGIAPVLHQEEGRWLPTWQPWPGEQVTIDVSKPEGVSGQTFTVDRVDTTFTPGARATDVSVKTVLRSSLGGNHRFDLPAQAELLAVAVDGQVLPVQAQGGAVMVPITPGAHVVKVDWREPRGMGGLFKTTAVNVGAPGVNDALHVNVPQDRVVLALGGPAVGPAVLFWGVLLVIVAVALGLARLRLTPLSAVSWVLLGLGIAQMSLIGMVGVTGWFMVLAARRRFGAPLSRRAFMAMQVLVAVWGVLAAAVLLETVRVGLLGYPDLMIVGNASDASHLHWFADRFKQSTAQAWVVSVPVLVYRLAMLLWALWLAASMLRWIKWAWECFSAGGYWPDSVKVNNPG